MAAQQPLFDTPPASLAAVASAPSPAVVAPPAAHAAPLAAAAALAGPAAKPAVALPAPAGPPSALSGLREQMLLLGADTEPMELAASPRPAAAAPVVPEDNKVRKVLNKGNRRTA